MGEDIDLLNEATTLDPKKRDEVEALVIKFFDTLDKSKTNSEYYKELFASMSDAQFVKFMSKDLPFRFQYRPSVSEPTMTDIKKSLDVIGVPMLEKIHLPYLHEDANGRSITTAECFVGYTHHKPVQQYITKKNKWATEITNRNMKTGRLNGNDKGSAESDREFESLAVFGLEHTAKELYTYRADSMDAKNVAYSQIKTLGMVREEDIPFDNNDSLSNNMLSAYLIGAGINSNLVNTGYMTPYTMKNKSMNSITRNSE